MNSVSLESDQLKAWSEGHTANICFRLAKTTQHSPTPNPFTQVDLARLSHRAVQAMWQTGMQMRRRPWPWPEILSFSELPGLAAANGLRAAGVLRTSGGMPRQLSPHPRDPGGDLRDQPRTAAPSRGAVDRPHERIAGGPPLTGRFAVGWHASRQHARRLARRQHEDFVHCGGSR